MHCTIQCRTQHLPLMRQISGPYDPSEGNTLPKSGALTGGELHRHDGPPRNRPDRRQDLHPATR